MFFGLNEAEPERVQPKQIERSFDFNDDIEEFGKKQDIKNRERFSKEECDSLFIASTEVIDDINLVASEDAEGIEKRLKEIKKQALEEEGLFASEEFDIFGTITEDMTKINDLGNVKHREIKKSKFRVLEINKNTNKEQYINSLNDVIKYINSGIDKAKFGMKLNVFCASTGALNNKRYNILYINPQNALDTLKEEEKINLYNIKLNENSKAIALTNIIYYDNKNKTLPIRNEYIR